jgi:hypothetical protein
VTPLARTKVALREEPWWTEADDAELDCLVCELVDAVLEHRGWCETCRAGQLPCRQVGTAIDVVLKWRQLRIFRSRAAYLGALQDLLEGKRPAA